MTECRCGRLRAMPDDRQRWRDNRATRLETRPGRLVQIPISAAHVLSVTWQPDLMWALALCGSFTDDDCDRPRRWASDRHIAEARRMFDLYFLTPS